MKVFISADIEGTNGISHWNETNEGADGYRYYAAKMTDEVAAVCSGVNDAYPDCGILVKDAHGSGRNIDHQKLPENVLLNRNWSEAPDLMTDGADGSYDAAIFTGYHSGAGSGGNPLAHTMSLGIISITINGIAASECLIGYYSLLRLGVPLVMVAGDEALCESMKKIEPNLYTVACLSGEGGSATSAHPEIIKAQLRRTAREAVINRSKMNIKPPGAFKTEIYFREHARALRASYYPGAVKTGAHTVAFDAGDFYDFLKYLLFVE